MDIQPEKQNLDQTFSTTVYHIDFYQRDYKWTEEPVRRLLDDVFYHFEESYQNNSSLEPSKENINGRYPWYYLNTYVTNTVSGRVFVVDGQQRLTTLTLILIKLLRMAKDFDSKTAQWLERKIAGFSGVDYEFWMNHTNQRHIFESLMSGTNISEVKHNNETTTINILSNYRTISDDLERRLKSPHCFETFVYYFLLRLVLVNLSVDMTHVPMVFEVINDRGVRLKPYEILKGKLLGQIDKLELDAGGYNELWERQTQMINEYRTDEIDSFFRYWLKAKFSDNRKAGQRFDGDYHREMFKSDMNTLLCLEHNPAKTKEFLKGAFRYYTTLFGRLWEATKTERPAYPSVFFNNLNELDSQFMLVLAACSVDDPEEEEKIKIVSDSLDRMFVLLQLQGAYDSNAFIIRIFQIAQEIREIPAQEIANIFDKHLREELAERRSITDPLAWNENLFRPMSIDRLNTRFIRYFFARIERMLAEGMNLKMKNDFRELVTSRGHKTGFHVEHILSHNVENFSMFNNDAELFQQERNRLGGILLLKGKDNISSNNEIYSEKLQSYANTLYWNESLRIDFYKSKLDFKEFAKSSGLDFKPLSQFGQKELNERQNLLFKIVSIEWNATLS